MRPNCYVEEDHMNYPALLCRERTHDRGTIYTHVCDTHGVGSATAMLCGKDIMITPPFSTSTTFKHSSTGCMDGVEGSPPVQERSVGLDVINNGARLNTILAPAYTVSPHSDKLQLYDTAASLCGTKYMRSTDMGEGNLHQKTPMYFDIAEPASVIGGATVESESYT